jgi:hypothetical protein
LLISCCLSNCSSSTIKSLQPITPGFEFSLSNREEGAKVYARLQQQRGRRLIVAGYHGHGAHDPDWWQHQAAGREEDGCVSLPSCPGRRRAPATPNASAVRRSWRSAMHHCTHASASKPSASPWSRSTWRGHPCLSRLSSWERIEHAWKGWGENAARVSYDSCCFAPAEINHNTWYCSDGSELSLHEMGRWTLCQVWLRCSPRSLMRVVSFSFSRNYQYVYYI